MTYPETGTRLRNKTFTVHRIKYDNNVPSTVALRDSDGRIFYIFLVKKYAYYPTKMVCFRHYEGESVSLSGTVNAHVGSNGTYYSLDRVKFE